MGWSNVCIESFCSINNKSIYWAINKSVKEKEFNMFLIIYIIELVIVFQCFQDLLLCFYQLLVRIQNMYLTRK